MQESVLLVLANKRDMATMNVQFLTEKLGLNEMKRNWAIFPVCAIKDEGHNLDAAMEWMISNINDISHPKKVVKIGNTLTKG